MASPSSAFLPPSRGIVGRVFHGVGGFVKNSLAAVGLVSGVAAATYFYPVFYPPQEDTRKKKTLVIPFNQLKLVERKEVIFDQINSGSDPVMELREFVNVLHYAASDPSIGAMYGIFGRGSQLASAGWAELEEVRNALKVFRESHRQHPEPNLQHLPQTEKPPLERKLMFAYADTFANESDPANKDYYVASMFPNIIMQKNGEWEMLGMTSQQLFFRDFLNRYKIIMHVFKSGAYKNFPNRFTETGFTKAHRENVTNILEEFDASVFDDIFRARERIATSDDIMPYFRKRIHEWGTFSANEAQALNVIDMTSESDALPLLRTKAESNMVVNKAKDSASAADSSLTPTEADVNRFDCVDKIDLKDYAKKVARKKLLEDRRAFWTKQYNLLVESPSSLGRNLHKYISQQALSKKKESVAVLYVTGAIGDTAAKKTIRCIRKIQKEPNCKCVVVRVSSPGGEIVACETILQELKALGIPVVFSFGNVAASGGYYIATAADRIFASKKTITGSIGVFGIRLDLTDFAAKYGITVDQVSTGELASQNNSFNPMTRKMKKNIADRIDKYYLQFKNVVAEGRKTSLSEVEAIAQGRVWTGAQGKINGLVDELGGLHRAIAYAQRKYTQGEARVVEWPKKVTPMDRLLEALEAGDSHAMWSLVYGFLMGQPRHTSSPATCERTVDRLVDALLNGSLARNRSGGIWLTVDENTAFGCLLEDLQARKSHDPITIPSFFWQ